MLGRTIILTIPQTPCCLFRMKRTLSYKIRMRRRILVREEGEEEEEGKRRQAKEVEEEVEEERRLRPERS
ncbi:hypothetical protein J2TS4_48950 [Paenibacillus sp. J2TS4]|nr:hypothetical protein J2TS4_48950 [Paenibacillus sp. J2TS4]